MSIHTRKRHPSLELSEVTPYLLFRCSEIAIEQTRGSVWYWIHQSSYDNEWGRFSRSTTSHFARFHLGEILFFRKRYAA